MDRKREHGQTTRANLILVHAAWLWVAPTLIVAGSCSSPERTINEPTSSAGNMGSGGVGGAAGEAGASQAGAIAIPLGGEPASGGQPASAGDFSSGNAGGADNCDQGLCSPRSEMKAAPVACGYCGSQPRKQVCTDACDWGEPIIDGDCSAPECPGLPGDERPGVVNCNGAPSAAPQNCCVGATGGTCSAKACAATSFSSCDGPEDCNPGEYCTVEAAQMFKRGACSTDGNKARWCHADPDCGTGTPYCVDSKRYPLSNNFGTCTATAPK